MTKKRNSNLVLGAGAAAVSSDAESTAADMPTDENTADQNNPASGGDQSTAPAGDGNTYATITKTYTSGGFNGKMKTKIEATYEATKDAKTGVASFETFSLTFTDIDNKVSSTIEDYAITNTDWTPIPAPSDKADAAKFRPDGDVKIDVQMSGKMMRVRFNMGGDTTPSDIGYIFELNIPADTEFSPKKSGEQSS